MPYRSGRHFLQIPGPTNVPDRVLRAIDRATMDHRGPDFGPMGLEILEGLKKVFQTRAPVVIYPASGLRRCRRGREVPPATVEAERGQRREHRATAVGVVHNVASTGLTSRDGAIRKALTPAGHPALSAAGTIASVAAHIKTRSPGE